MSAAVASGSVAPDLCVNLTEQERAQVTAIIEERTRLQGIVDTLTRANAEVAAAKVKAQSAKQYEPEKARQVGRKKFNVNPKKGMQFMFEHNVVENDPVAVAKWLHKAEGISKCSIGDYLGTFSEFHLTVLNQFVEMLDFKGMDFLPSLRRFLFPFRLPGEGQVISRFMERFAAQYKEHNPDSAITEDGAFILAYSSIMLNTDLHNPLNKNKMSLKAFTANNRGINSGEDIPADELERIFDSIKEEEFQYPKGEDGLDLFELFVNPERQGFLHKQGGRNKNWKKRWCIITGNCLYYFKEEKKTNDEVPLGIVPLEALAVRTLSKPKFAFEIYNPLDESFGIKSCKTKNQMVIKGHHATFVLYAGDDDERKDWMRSLKASMSNDPCYDLFLNKRDESRSMDA